VSSFTSTIYVHGAALAREDKPRRKQSIAPAGIASAAILPGRWPMSVEVALGATSRSLSGPRLVRREHRQRAGRRSHATAAELQVPAPSLSTSGSSVPTVPLTRAGPYFGPYFSVAP